MDEDVKQCPRCKSYSLYPAGQVHAGHSGKMVTVYMCHRCGYRTVR